MLKFLLKILIPFNSPRYLFPIAGVVCILAIGVGLFWSVQILLSNYLDSLIEKAIESKEEYAVIKNPDKKYMSEEEEEAEFFGTQKNDFSDRMRISVSAFQKISQELSHLQDIICKPVVRQSDFIFFDQDREIKYQCCLIGYDMDEGRNAFPVLDKVSEAIRQQYIEASAGDIAPALISKELVADKSKRKSFGWAIENWGNIESRSGRKQYSRIREYMFMALVAKTEVDWIALDKGEITSRKVVDLLIDKMEQYANYGFDYIADKLEDNPDHFFKDRAFLNEIIKFMISSEDVKADNNDDEEAESLD